MTEQEWLTCKDLDVMLRFLEGKISERKLRLFAIACCRRVPRLLREDVCQRALEVAERFADGAASRRELEELRKVLIREATQGEGWSAHRAVRILAGCCVDPHLQRHGVSAVELARRFATVSRREENRFQIGLLKDTVGNPFRVAVVDGSWLTWKDRTIPKFAQAMYDDQAFDRLPILADALEEAGCTNAAILNHCRQEGEHVKGCWVVDVLLGKE